MNSGTYSASLNSMQWGLARKSLQPSLHEATSDWNKEFQEINLMASRLAVVSNGFEPMVLFAPSLSASLGTFSSAIRLPMEAVSNALGQPIRPLSVAAMIPIELVSAMAVPLLSFVNDPLTGVLEEPQVIESPQVEYRGWGEYVEPAEYEARLAAISPKPANGEAEEHVPPTPRGKIRAIPLR